MTGQENKRPNELIEHAPVTLRRFRAEDVDALFHAVTESLDHLRPWMPWAADYSLASAEEYLAGSVKSWDELRWIPGVLDALDSVASVTSAGTGPL